MNSFTINTATVADIPTMCEWGSVHAELWTNGSEAWYTAQNLALWMEMAPNDIFLVARIRGELIGMCTVYSLYSWAFCDGLYVVEEYRRQGVGKSLLSEAEKILKSRGITDISLIVQVANQKAYEFYLDEGFKEGYQFRWMNKPIDTVVSD